MSVVCCLFIVFALNLFASPAVTDAEEPWFSYTVTLAEGNLATLTADVMLAAPPETVYAVLTDYSNWSDLFAQRLIINVIHRINNQVRVDMTINSSFWPIELTLVTETRVVAPTTVQTTLIQGDFEQYDWVWTLRPAQHAQHTKATVVVHLQPSLWIPQWVFHWLVTEGFTDHVHQLRDLVQRREHVYKNMPILSSPSRSP